MAFTKYPTRSAAASALKIIYNLPAFEQTNSYTASALITKDGSIVFDAELFQRGDATHLADLRTTLGVNSKVQAQTVAYAATITPNIALGTLINVGSITGALTIAAPTGTPYDGQELKFRLNQDGTGHAITWNSAFAFATHAPSSQVAVTANAKAEADFRWNAADSKWRATRTDAGY